MVSKEEFSAALEAKSLYICLPLAPWVWVTVRNGGRRVVTLLMKDQTSGRGAASRLNHCEVAPPEIMRLA